MSTKERLTKAVEELEKAKAEVLSALDELRESRTSVKIPPELDTPEFRDFLKKPYVVIPKDKDSYYVVVPRFVDFYVGWLAMQTETYNVFEINRFTTWFTPDLPEDLRRLVGESRQHAWVEDGLLKTTKDQGDTLWKKYRKHLSKRIDDTTIKIKKGHEFELIAELIDGGILPFRPRPVAERDIRPWDGIKLRNYQQRAWEEFLARGSIGLFWPPGVGKSYFGIYVLARIKGRKLVLVPTKTLAEQWSERIEEHVPQFADEIEVMTYASFHKVRNEEFSLVIFDEVHHLPAPTYIRLSTLKRKYTIGLSASPYREDGKEAYIIALTGYPVGMDWNSFIKRGLVSRPVFRIKLVRSESEKIKMVGELLRDNKKTIVFCDYLDLGRKIASRYGLDFIHGKTKKRLNALRDCKAVVVSRVGDEGISLPDVERVVEVAFLGRSRRQQVQRFGRLLHSSRSVDHVLLMTHDEFERFGSRVYAVEEKGFRVVVEV